MMKNFYLLIILSILPSLTLANVKLINHFDQPIHFILALHPQTVADFPVNFTLNPNEQAESHVSDDLAAYIRGIDGLVHNGFKDSVYFSVDYNQGETLIRGYMSHGIAYSWVKGTVTFCTPQYYQAHQHSCSF